MTMDNARLQSGSHWQPQMTLLLVTMLSLLGVSLGQINIGAPCGHNGYICPSGYCCNTNFTCGNTTVDCDTNCLDQCTPGFMKCGPSYDAAVCPDGQCCSTNSWCGGDYQWCGQSFCASQCPADNCPNGGNCTCGANGGICPDGYCCNISGFCGTTAAFCILSCASQCPPPPPSPSPTPSPTPSPSPSPSPIGLIDPGKSVVLGHGKPGGNKLGLIVGLSTGIPVFLIASSVVITLFVRRRYGGGGHLGWSTFAEDDPQIQIEGMPERFSYKQLSVATRAFTPESKLGQGGFGSVYRGVLPASGIPVAVKKISSDSRQGEKEFMAEVSIISRLRHRNLIQLQGWCQDTARGNFLLVYELMPNGSLDKALFEPSHGETASLSWSQRFNIVTGTAAAVDYLHQGWTQQVIHRDIKSSNIMLDNEWNPKLGDFGLARLVDHQRAGATTVVAGTYGYIAPEVVASGRFTEKTDVYAFGAVVLEIACGRRAFSDEFPPEETVLVDWVWGRLSEDAVFSTVDKRLEGNYDTYMMEVMLIVGLLCSHPDPQARPSMRHVVEVLAGHVPVPSIPACKPSPVFTSDSHDFFMKSFRGPKSGSISKSGSGSISLVSRTTSDSTGSSSVTSAGASSNSNPLF